MVKIAFNSALAQKAPGKEAPADVKVSGGGGGGSAPGVSGSCLFQPG